MHLLCMQGLKQKHDLLGVFVALYLRSILIVPCLHCLDMHNEVWSLHSGVRTVFGNNQELGDEVSRCHSGQSRGGLFVTAACSSDDGSRHQSHRCSNFGSRFWERSWHDEGALLHDLLVRGWSTKQSPCILDPKQGV